MQCKHLSCQYDYKTEGYNQLYKTEYACLQIHLLFHLWNLMYYDGKIVEDVIFKFYHIIWKLLSYIVFAKSLICIISNEVWHIVMRYITNSRHKTFCDKTEEVAAAYYLGWINICPSFHPLAKVWYSIYTLQRFTYMLVPNSNGWRKALVVNIRHMDLPSVTFITLHLEKIL